MAGGGQRPGAGKATPRRVYSLQCSVTSCLPPPIWAPRALVLPDLAVSVWAPRDLPPVWAPSDLLLPDRCPTRHLPAVPNRLRLPHGWQMRTRALMPDWKGVRMARGIVPGSLRSVTRLRPPPSLLLCQWMNDLFGSTGRSARGGIERTGERGAGRKETKRERNEGRVGLERERALGAFKGPT